MSMPKLPKSVKLETKPSNFCPGCGHSLTLKTLGFVMDELNIAEKSVFVTDIGCSLLAWDYYNVNTVQSHHGRGVSISTGIKRALPKKVIISYMGDGGGYAIGLHHLLHAAKRNEAITVILVNNTVFAMTGGQAAPTTVIGENTESTPMGKFVEGPLFGPGLIREVADKKAFIARTSVDNLPQLKNYIARAIENQIKNNSFSFVEVLSYCPTNWKTNTRETFDFLDQIKKTYQTGIIEHEDE
jgi:2-oxoglutarate ferredoxin oxidoreductase subunit beta